MGRYAAQATRNEDTDLETNNREEWVECE